MVENLLICDFVGFSSLPELLEAVQSQVLQLLHVSQR
jgi:hypothetical protein